MRGARGAVVRTAAALSACGLLLAGVVSCADATPAGGALPTMPLGPDGIATIEFRTTADLIRDSYVVARGRFVGGPTVLTSSAAGEEMPWQVVLWEFVPDEVYRDVRLDDAPARRAEEQRGSIPVVAGVNLVGATRGDQPIGAFVRSFPSQGNLNTVPVDRPVYVFLHPGGAPREAVARDPGLAYVMAVTETIHCYLVDDLGRSCLSVADVPGGEPLALPEDGGLVPRDLTREAIEDAGSVLDVVEHPVGEADSWIDVGRYGVLPARGGEG